MNKLYCSNFSLVPVKARRGEQRGVPELAHIEPRPAAKRQRSGMSSESPSWRTVSDLRLRCARGVALSSAARHAIRRSENAYHGRIEKSASGKLSEANREDDWGFRKQLCVFS